MTVLALPLAVGEHKYIGASTDTKPTLASHASLPEPVVGAEFYEYDTGLLYVTYDRTNWSRKDQAIGHGVTGIGHGTKVVTTAGTDVALAATTAAKYVMIQAQTDNTNAIAVGGSGVDAVVATGTGLLLYAGEWSPWIPCDNLADIFIDSLADGEGVRYIYLT